MKYVADNTGRFVQRPYYEPEELDFECEHIITRFLKERCGQVLFPIPTDILTKLIEHDAEDLDLYADLSNEGSDVQAVTEFYPPHKPKVKIAKELSEQAHREHRLRTTLSHEYGHVKFHAYLWDIDARALSLFPELRPAPIQRCRRSTMLDALATDWMEWQAGYICGAILMPRRRITSLVSDFFHSHSLYAPILIGSPAASELEGSVAEYFDVSLEAAKVRLSKLNFVSRDKPGTSLF